jgi:hypothetical protein
MSRVSCDLSLTQTCKGCSLFRGALAHGFWHDRIPTVPFGAETCAAHDGGVLYGDSLNSQPTDGKYSAGVCAAGMGYYGMLPPGGMYIGLTGACSGAGGCGGGVSDDLGLAYMLIFKFCLSSRGDAVEG